MSAAEIAPWLIRSAAFVFGALWGSFFNVAIYRWPREMSVVTPPSHCPHCETPIRAYRNVPILGWLILRGKASCCGASITPRYVLIETLSALLCLAVAERWIVQASADSYWLWAVLEALLYFAFAGGLLIATFVDLEWMEIPDEVSLPGTALGLISATFRKLPGAADAAIGAGAGFLIIQVPFVWMYEHLFGKRGMGEGDSKLLMMIGAFVGLRGVFFSLVAGAFQGLVYTVISLLFGRELTPTRPDAETQPDLEDLEEAGSAKGRLKVPFGPFLALSALEYLFFGDALIEAYFRLLGSLMGR